MRITGWMGVIIVSLACCNSIQPAPLREAVCNELGIDYKIPVGWQSRYFSYSLHSIVEPHLEISTGFLGNHILFNTQSGKPEIEVDENSFWIGVFRLGKIVDGTLRAFGRNEFIEVDSSEESWVLQSPMLGLEIHVIRQERVFQQEIEIFLESLSMIP